MTSDAEGTDVTDKLQLSAILYWLGLTTSTSNTWVTGEGTKYTSFAPGEPSDPALRCVAFDGAAPNGAWRSQGCAKKLGYVCERSPAFVFPVDHHAYRLRTGAVDINGARDACVADGGHLAALETEAERLFVGKNVGIAAWLDAADSATQGRFVWPSGQPVDPTAFAIGQPDGTNDAQDCLLFNPGDKFADAACSELHAYICEFD